MGLKYSVIFFKRTVIFLKELGFVDFNKTAVNSAFVGDYSASD